MRTTQTRVPATTRPQEKPQVSSKADAIRWPFSKEFLSRQSLRQEMLAFELSESLWSTLPVSGVSPSDFPDLAAFHSVYVASHEGLLRARSETRRWLLGMLALNVEVQAESTVDTAELSKVADRQLADIAAAVDLKTPPAHSYGAHLSQLPIADAVELLRTELRDSAVRLAEEFVAACGRLHANGQVGLIEWYTEDACRFTFSAIGIKQKGVQREVRKEVKRSPERNPGGAPHYMGYKEHDETTREIVQTIGEHEITWTLHVHDVLPARRTQPEDESLKIPERLTQVLGQTPEWIRPHLSIAAGQRIRERQAKKVMAAFAFRRDDVLWEQTRVVTRICPAVSLGDFCLTGWGDTEEAAETARRNFPTAIGASVAMQFFAAWLMMRGDLAASPAVFAAGVLTGLAGLVPAGLAVRNWYLAQRRPLDGSFQLASFAAVATIGAAQALLHFLAVPNLPMLIITGLFGAASAYLGHAWWSARPFDGNAVVAESLARLNGQN